MSVDVFGHQLHSGGGGRRGPPGEGFRLTQDAQYDIQNKRLCNVTAPVDDLDAVNLGTLRQIVQKRTELQEVKGMVESLYDAFDNTLNQWKADLEGVKMLIHRNAQLIAHLDSKVNKHV